MIQSFFLFLVLALFLGSITLFSIKRLHGTEEELKKKNKELSRRLYELSVSQSVAEQIGYSLNINTIISSIVETAGRVIEHSALSYALLDNKTITYRAIEDGFVGPIFLEQLKKDTLACIYEHIQNPTDLVVIASSRKEFSEVNPEYFNEKPASFYGLPLIINDQCIGAICISSSKKNAFSDDDKALLRRTVDNTLETVGKIEGVINTEKGKLDSFLFSLTSGALLFLIEKDTLRLSAINTAAKDFLHVVGKPDTAMVIAHFGMHYDLIQDIKEVAIQKKSTILKDVSIYERSFKVYLNPVFLHSTQSIIGVAVTMEDVTFERDIEKMRETFTSMVVHELRAPLTSIKGASQLLLDGKLGKDDMSKMLHIVHDSTERMLSDIGDILDMSKLEAGKFTLNKTASSINELVKEKALTFSFVAQTRHITINTNLDTTIAQSMFDVQRIGQVLNNLFSNALKFTPDNGIITATTALHSGQITVSVHDNGVGVPQEKIALLFSKYGQLASGLRKEGGTGLGLYISKGIVESHGGKIWLDSHEGEGTTVSFSFPFIAKIDQPAVESNTVPASKVIPQNALN